jgi:hypothetical protein
LAQHLLVQAAALQLLVIQNVKNLNAEATICHQDEAAFFDTLTQLLIADADTSFTCSSQ